MNPAISLTQATTANTDFTALKFMIDQALSRIETATLVKVISCTNDGGISPAGFVNVQPLVAQVDGNGNSYPHGVLNNLLYIRYQGGVNAIIIDPKPGDIGIAVFCSRDISTVKSTRDVSPPGGYRQHDMSDGVYIGTVLNVTPTNFIQIDNNQITITTPMTLTINATDVVVNADIVTVNAPSTQINGDVNVNGVITADDIVVGGKSVLVHTHSGVQSGSNNSGGMT